MRIRRATGAAMVGAGALVGLLLTGTSAGAAAPGVKVVADHLNNPRQIATRNGDVYVAEAGTGGPNCGPDGTCFGFTGSVTRLRSGQAQRIQTDLISIATPDGEVVGVDAVAFRDADLFGIATGTCDTKGIPASALAQLGHILRLQGGSRVSAVADVSSVECKTDPDGQGPDTDPYGLTTRDGAFFVADAAGNDIVKAKNGNVTAVAVLSKTAQPVPTSLAIGPDGALYIGTLNFEGGPGAAKVYRLGAGEQKASVYASGLSAITGIAFDGDGKLYVSEFTTAFDQNGPTPAGAVVVVPKGGGMAGRKTLGEGVLHFPGGVAVTRDGVFVSNWSIAGAQDGPFGPGNHGQLVELPR